MAIRHLLVKNFRGIRHLEWRPHAGVNGIIGAGDSRKSTLLAAIEFVLTPRFSLIFTDADFYDGDNSQAIEIEATVGNLPDEYRNLTKLGKYMRGWRNGAVEDEPLDGCEEVITIALRVDDSLEPLWTAKVDRPMEVRPITSRERERLGVHRLGPTTDRDLYWSRSSALSRLTGKQSDLDRALNGATRSAQRAVDDAELKELRQTTDLLVEAAKEYGARPAQGLRPRLDLHAAQGSGSWIGLHDGAAPARMLGTASRTLYTIAAQQNVASKHTVSLIDEIEVALEPHRLRNLIQTLRRSLASNHSQLVLTTHSPIAIVELNATDLWVARSSPDGSLSLIPVPRGLQPTVRQVPESLLAPRVLVCEGKTEYGMMRAYDARIAELVPAVGGFAYRGIVAASCGGSEATRIAREFHELGYDVAYFGDSDTTDIVSPSFADLEALGIPVWVWPGGVCTERRLLKDLPLAGVCELLVVAAEYRGQESILSSISTKLKVKTLPGLNVQEWGIADEAAVRDAIAEASLSKSGTWFKRPDLGERLGQIVFKHAAALKDTPTGKTFAGLRAWIDRV